VVRAATQGVGALLPGADELPWEVWTSLPGIRDLSLILRMVDEVSHGHAVVVDAGSLDEAVRLASLPGSALRVLDALMTPDLAMHRTPAGAGPFEALSSLRSAVARAARVLRDPSTVMRLATDGDPASVEALRSADAALGAQGIGVDGIVVMRRKGERADADAVVARLLPMGVAAWSTGRRVRPAPSGRLVSEVLSRPRGLRADQLEVIHEGELMVAVVPCEADRVGIDGDDLVIEVSGSMRWIPLPAALTRCSVVSARRMRGTVEVSFRPDESRWRPAS